MSTPGQLTETPYVRQVIITFDGITDVPVLVEGNVNIAALFNDGTTTSKIGDKWLANVAATGAEVPALAAAIAAIRAELFNRYHPAP